MAASHSGCGKSIGLFGAIAVEGCIAVAFWNLKPPGCRSPQRNVWVAGVMLCASLWRAANDPNWPPCSQKRSWKRSLGTVDVGEAPNRKTTTERDYEHVTYCWWKKSCTSWNWEPTIILQGFIHLRWCRISPINSSAGSLWFWVGRKNGVPEVLWLTKSGSSVALQKLQLCFLMCLGHVLNSDPIDLNLQLCCDHDCQLNLDRFCPV